MTSVHYNLALHDDDRRRQLYEGDLFVYTANEHTLALTELASRLLHEAFGGRDPRTVQYQMPAREYAQVMSRVKPKFIHHPDCKVLLPRLMASIGCDLEQTFFDVPRMRSATSDGYLTTGIAYAFHPHRDTWYSAPMCQINWWLPVFEIEAGRAMAFHPRYFGRPVTNDSQVYDYARWNATSRFNAADHVGLDTRVQPMPKEQLALDPAIVVVTPPGGMVLFSAAQLHSTVPNETGETRYSLDFRTVHLGDLRSRRGARNVDSRCTGSAIDDYLRATDLSHVPADVQAIYSAGHPQPVEV